MSGGHNSHHENYQCPMETRKKSLIHSIQKYKRTKDILILTLIFKWAFCSMVLWFKMPFLCVFDLCGLDCEHCAHWTALSTILFVFFFILIFYFFSLAKISFHNKNEWKTARRINSPVMSPNNTKPKVLSLYASCQLCFT